MRKERSDKRKESYNNKKKKKIYVEISPSPSPASPIFLCEANKKGARHAVVPQYPAFGTWAIEIGEEPQGLLDSVIQALLCHSDRHL